MEEHDKKHQAQEAVELNPEELEAEVAAELPDREALSLISPGGTGSFTTIGDPAPFHPPVYDTTQPVPRDTL